MYIYQQLIHISVAQSYFSRLNHSLLFTNILIPIENIIVSLYCDFLTVYIWCQKDDVWMIIQKKKKEIKYWCTEIIITRNNIVRSSYSSLCETSSRNQLLIYGNRSWFYAGATCYCPFDLSHHEQFIALFCKLLLRVSLSPWSFSSRATRRFVQ